MSTKVVATVSNGSKAIAVVVEWRSRTRSKILPSSDLRWTRFCTVFEEVRQKKPKAACAPMVIAALNREHKKGLFEFRAGKESVI